MGAKPPLPGMQAIEGLESLLIQIDGGKIEPPFIITLEHGEDGERLIIPFGEILAEVKVKRDEDPKKTFATIKLVLRSTDLWKIKAGDHDAKGRKIFLLKEFDK